MAWLSKLANIALWPVKAAKLTVVYISRPFVSSALLVARSFVTIVAPGSGDSAPSHAAELTVAPTTEAVIPDTGATSDGTSQQLGAWAWVSTRVRQVTHLVVIQPMKFVRGRVSEKWDRVYDWITAHSPQLSLRHALIGLFGLVGTYLSINIIVMNMRDSPIVRRFIKPSSGEEEEEPISLPPPTDPAVEEFIRDHYPGCKSRELCELGSRMKKGWVELVTKADAEGREEDQRWMLTYAPLSQSCPLLLHEHQKGLNKLLTTIKEHPCIHPVKEVYYSAGHEKLIIVQPYRQEGSLKDLIYEVSDPTLDWSQKYARRSRGLSPDTVARYGRHILEGMMFLNDLGFPLIDHVQTGNIFVVDDVCLLGGYENSLLGYKTRIYRLCKDHLSHFDVILFGHLIFEMSAGYELTEVRPGPEAYRSVPSAVRPILEFIFADGFPHSIRDIAQQDFFQDVSDLPPELMKFDASTIHAQLSDSAKTVLEKVRKNKPRVQKPPSTTEAVIKAVHSRIRVPWFFRVKRDHKHADQVSISSKHKAYSPTIK